MRILKSGIITAAALLITAGAVVVSCGKNGKLSEINVAPLTAGMALNTTQQFTATAKLSDGVTLDWTSEAAWTSSDTSIATVNDTFGYKGIVTAGSTTGTVVITATDPKNHITGAATLFIGVPASITVSPTDALMPFSTTKQFLASATLYSQDTGTVTQNITTFATWTAAGFDIASTPSNSIATVGTTVGVFGIVSSLTTTGTATITATWAPDTYAISSSATVSVVNAKLTSVTIYPTQYPSTNPLTVTRSQTNEVLYTATGTYTNGFPTQEITSSVIWISSNTTVAQFINTVGGQGHAILVGTGTTSITAQDPVTGIVSASKILVVN